MASKDATSSIEEGEWTEVKSRRRPPKKREVKEEEEEEDEEEQEKQTEERKWENSRRGGWQGRGRGRGRGGSSTGEGNWRKAASAELKAGMKYKLPFGVCFYHLTREGCISEKNGRCKRRHDPALRQSFIHARVFLCLTMNFDHEVQRPVPCGELFDSDKKQENGDYYKNCLACCLKWIRSRTTLSEEEKKKEEEESSTTSVAATEPEETPASPPSSSSS